MSLALCTFLFVSCGDIDKGTDDTTDNSSQGGNGTINESGEGYSKGLSFVLDGDKYGVSGIGTCKDTAIKIPSTYNGKPVAYIYGYAFENCASITSVIIPDSVEAICDGAFIGCTSLSSVSIGNGVTSIGLSSFYSTAYYNDESNWENGVLYIGKYLIKSNNTLSGSYVVKEDTLCVAASAFSWCTKLTSVVIPNSVKSIGDEVFDECAALASVTIGNGVKNIGKEAFDGCRSLITIAWETA